MKEELPRDKEAQFEKYMELLQEGGNSEAYARHIAYTVRLKKNPWGYLLLFFVLAGCSWMFYDFASVRDLGWPGGCFMSVVLALFGSLLSAAVIYPSKNYEETSLSYKKFLNSLTSENRMRVKKHFKKKEILLEYEADEEDFLMKYMGQCSDEMIEATKVLIEKDPEALIKLTDPESEEHQLIKPQVKLLARGKL